MGRLFFLSFYSSGQVKLSGFVFFTFDFSSFSFSTSLLRFLFSLPLQFCSFPFLFPFSGCLPPPNWILSALFQTTNIFFPPGPPQMEIQTLDESDIHLFTIYWITYRCIFIYYSSKYINTLHMIIYIKNSKTIKSFQPFKHTKNKELGWSPRGRAHFQPRAIDSDSSCLFPASQQIYLYHKKKGKIQT